MYLALIKNGIVHSVILGDEDFIKHIEGQYDLVLDVSDRERPSPGDSYYADQDEFHSNTLETVHIQVDLDAEHLKQGTEIGFEPFRISKYPVEYVDRMVQIGCKKYSAPGLLDALHKILIENQHSAHCFTGYAHGKFSISREDAEKLYETLRKVKF